MRVVDPSRGAEYFEDGTSSQGLKENSEPDLDTQAGDAPQPPKSPRPIKAQRTKQARGAPKYKDLRPNQLRYAANCGQHRGT
ncbi:hypothetical protein PCANC_02615 [Puccinia coronata f. sp. avenae]|uniref:Uncharacterized protein n=1 Tax=Puccinia coronata f. sp. avenae TaxID=200324 RepID=A0A2N5W5F9_9BASI|nr:hypothetical protein PCANC_02615 [Puccinia coronata f. sp. avenae]